MKKALVILLATLLVLSFSVMSFAKVGGFVSSPTGDQAPTVDSFKPSNPDCDGKLVVTPYGDRDELPEDLRTAFENAYKSIAGASDLTKLSEDLSKIASDKKIKAENLAVSDLFNLHATGCDTHEGHYDFEITLSSETLGKFVALLQMNSSGQWEVVSGAQVINGGKNLKFSVKTLSPLAIVVNTGTVGPDVPPTSDNWMIYVYGSVAAVSAVALVVVWVVWRKSKKQGDC